MSLTESDLDHINAQVRAICDAAKLLAGTVEWLAKPAPKFKVGDRVRIRATNQIGDVTDSSYSSGGIYYKVKTCEPFPYRVNEAELEPAPDPLADVKAAHARGEVVQVRMVKSCQITVSDSTWTDYNGEYPNFDNPHWEWRVKPWSLTRSLPGFRPLNEGEEWHRADGWKEEWLSDGWRPLLKGEIIDSEANCLCSSYRHSGWGSCASFHGKPALPTTRHNFYNETVSDYHFRTKKPLPDPQREAFEKWYDAPSDELVQMTPKGIAWAAWQAASKQAARA